jgi:DNA-binding GntR family transcriptional regulator
MNAPLSLQRPQLLTDMARTRIRDAIVDGELKLGEQMSEAQLAQRMGISKTPVREALLRLQGDGLVEVHPQRGTFVFRLDAAQVGRLCRYRAMLECAALREAMAERRRGLLVQMARCVAEMKKAERAHDLRALARIDMDLHWQFLVHCPNTYLAEGYDVVRWQVVALRHRSPIADAVGSHQLLVDAVEDGNSDAACALLHEHVIENEPRYIAANDVD